MNAALDPSECFSKQQSSNIFSFSQAKESNYLEFNVVISSEVHKAPICLKFCEMI